MVGSDIPRIDVKILEEAFHALDRYDVVIGPSEDGGYYLLGTTALHVDLFENIPWSSPTTLQVTKERIDALHLTSVELKSLKDIDEPSDFSEWEQVSGKTILHYASL